MQAPTAKELEYIVDSMSNEELLLKQCAAVASITTNAAIRNQCLSQLQTHEQHLHTLMNVLQQGQSNTTAQSGSFQQWNSTHQH
jgi:hypothetical protein